MTDVFTPEMLASRWKCSPATVRRMIRGGKLRAFKLGGTLLRVTAEEVEQCERRTLGSTESESTADQSSSPSTMKPDSENAPRLARMIRSSRGPVLLNGRNNASD